MVFIRVCILCIINAEETVQRILTGVGRCCPGDLRTIHSFLAILFAGVSSALNRLRTVRYLDCCLYVESIAYLLNRIRKRKQEALTIYQWLYGFKNILTRTVLIFAERIVLPLGRFQL